MTVKRYKIADIHLNFDGTEYDYFSKRMMKYISTDTNCCDVNISYTENENIVLPSGKQYKMLHKWNWIETKDDKYIAFQQLPTSKKNLSLIQCDKEWKHANLQLCDFKNDLGITLEERCFMAVGEIFAYALLKHEGLVLHASTINYNGNGILFSAPSGTGKSTQTSLWKKYYGAEIINDDTPAIRIINNIPYVFGTPWSGKTEINSNCSIPIKAIVFITQCKENKIKQLNGSEAFSLMINETRKSVFPEMADLYLEMINKIVCSVPIYMLSCNISKEAVDIVKNTLEL